MWISHQYQSQMVIPPSNVSTWCIMSPFHCTCILLQRLSTWCSLQQMYIIQTLNNKIEVLFIFKWWHLLQIFYIYWNWNVWCENAGVGPVPKALLLEADRVVVSLMLLALIFFLSLSLTPHWLILFRLAWAGMHLMQFYVQAVWQWRVPSFCSINISFSIWMQI